MRFERLEDFFVRFTSPVLYLSFIVKFIHFGHFFGDALFLSYDQRFGELDQADARRLILRQVRAR